MPFTQEDLDKFMSTYEHNASSNPAATVTQFADPFLVGGPAGSIVVPAAAFAAKLPVRRQHFQNAGLRSSAISRRRDTRISDRYVLVDTQWKFVFTPNGKPGVTLFAASSFLIDMGGAEAKILVYLSHQDIFESMRSHNLES